MTMTPASGDGPFRCPHAGLCGGCTLMGLGYRDQLAMKQARVAALLKPFGRVEPIRGMEHPLHYRNKVHAVFAADRRGRLQAGVYQAGTHRVVPVEHCLIEDERADAILRTVLELARSFRYQPYDEDRRTGFLRHALVRAGRTETMLILVTAAPFFPNKNAFVKALLQAHPMLTTVVQNVNDRDTTLVLGRRDTVLYGKGYIEDHLCGKAFRVSPQAFYQVNSAQTEALYGLVGEMAALTGTETVLDAYCGVGTIGLTLADRCRRLTGVELNPQAVRDARINARRNGAVNALFVCGDAGRWMREQAVRGETLDVVLMDPPRSGSDEAFLDALIHMKPARVVYVSCDPETLARDLKRLTAGGYRVTRAVPVDMFPFTEHVECAVQLTRMQRQTQDGRQAKARWERKG